MSEPTDRLAKRLKIGTILVFITGLFPLLVSTIFYVLFWVSTAHPDQPWLASKFPYGKSPYTLADIQRCQPEAPIIATDFVLDGHIEFANVMNTGAIILVLAVFGLARRLQWSWYVLLAIMLWVGLNDALALIASGQFPIPAVAEVIGLVGLFIARPAVFDDRGS